MKQSIIKKNFPKEKKGIVFLSFRELNQDLNLTLNKVGSKKKKSIKVRARTNGFFSRKASPGKFLCLIQVFTISILFNLGQKLK